jgi:hypothetical protein
MPIRIKTIMTTAVVWVDSRRRASGPSDSDFEVGLRETIHMSNARLRVDKVTFTDSFLTTDAGSNLYFSSGSGGISHVSIPEGAYTGTSLAAAIQTATGRTTTYAALTNGITHTLAAASQPWLSDSALEAYSSGFPSGASADDAKSLNAVLGDGTNSSTQVVWSFVRMSPYNYVFLRSSRLRCVDHHGPRGTHDILCSIPLTGGPGTQVEASSPDALYYDLQGELSIRSFDLRLTDYLGRAVNLRGRPLALQITFDS